MSFKRHVDEIRSRTSISQTHIIHMRLGLTGIRETAVQPQALRRARRPAGIGAMLSMALAALTMTLAACDAGSPAAGGKANASGNAQVNAKADLNASANASVEAQANASPASGPMAASAVKVGAHEAGQIPRASLRVRAADDGAGQAAVLRRVAVRLGQAGVRVVPQSRIMAFRQRIRCRCNWAATTCAAPACAPRRRSSICNRCRRSPSTTTSRTTKAMKAWMPGRPAA